MTQTQTQTQTEARVNKLDDYAAVLGSGEISDLRALAARLAGRTVQMVNSTSVGGGVAEMLIRIVPLMCELNVCIRWDVITGGDHLWDQKEVMELLAGEKRFLRPLNYPAEVPGKGSGVFTLPGPRSGSQGSISVAVLNVQGRTFMQPQLDNPFPLAADEVKRLRDKTPIIFVDFHAEATSEKIALARFLDGQVSAVVGTHTHVQTADEQIFPGGTAYLSDAGFTGPHESVLGREIEPVIKKFLTAMPQRFEVAKDRVLLHGVVIEIDEFTGKAVTIQRVSEALR